MFYSAKKKGVIADLGTSEALAESVVFKDALALSGLPMKTAGGKLSPSNRRANRIVVELLLFTSQKK